MIRFALFRKSLRGIKEICYLILFIGLALYLIMPLFFYSSKRLQTHFVFRNDIEQPRSLDLTVPSQEGVIGAINRYIKTDGVTLGVWQILPISLLGDLPSINDYSAAQRDLWFLNQLADGKPVFIYCHGNKPSRASSYRILLYDILQAQNYHVIAFDYRGYADSEKIDPSENGVVADTINVHHWIRETTDAPIFVYGHSLGTGIAIHAASKLCQRNMCPAALFLQSPFTSIADELRSSYMTAPYRFLPWFDYMFIKPLEQDGIIFNSIFNILSVQCPIMILHAEDDIVVPFYLGQKLFESTKKNRNKSYGIVKFINFSSKLGYGHNYIYKSQLLPGLIYNFVEDSLYLNVTSREWDMPLYG